MSAGSQGPGATGARAANIEAERMALLAERRDGWGQVNRHRLRAVMEYACPSVLDVGCGTGGYVNYLAARGFNVCGLDLLMDAEWQPGAGRQYTVGDVRTLPFRDATFDTILAFEVLEHLPDPGTALSELRRVCARNIILTVPDCETPESILRAGLVYAHWIDRTHKSFFTERSLTSVLSRAGFRIVSTTRINAVLVDYPVLRSVHVPQGLAYLAARLMRRFPGRAQYCMTLLVVATPNGFARTSEGDRVGGRSTEYGSGV